MHVLMLSDVYFPRINGVSTSMETFRREFEAAGDTVTLIVPDYPGAVEEPGIIRIPSHGLPLDPEDRRMDYSPILALAPELAARGVDLVHIQTPFLAHYAGVALARRLGVPCVETYHTLFEEYFHHYIPFLPKALLRAVTRNLSRRQCDAVDAVIVPSSAMAERLTSYGVATPREIIPTGIPLERFGQGNGPLFRQHLGLGPEVPIALYVGRVAGEKNIDFLLRAHQQALTALPELRLVVAGEGPALAGLKKLAQKLGTTARVCFVGYLDRSRELPDCYAAADAFVFASRTETQGLVLLEAMAEGTPAVALALMGTRDILDPGQGAVVPRDDVGDFAAHLTALLADTVRRQRLAQEAREYVRQWSAPACARRLRTFLAGIHAGRPYSPTTSTNPVPATCQTTLLD